MEVKSDLTGVRVGDKLVSLRWGKATVIGMMGNFITCHTDAGGFEWFLDGRFCKENTLPDLYWPGVQIIPAKPPKRMKRVVMERWIGLFKKRYEKGCYAVALPGMDEFAPYCEANNVQLIGEPQRVAWEIEVEDA